MSSLMLEQFIRIFWYYLIFDFPRYILSDIYVLSFILKDRFRETFSKRQALFDHKLQHEPPLVSVIVSALNEARTIPHTLETILEQSYQNLEIIFVNDGSRDDTAQVMRHYTSPKIKYFELAVRSGKSAALNYGLRHARGEFIVYIDSDMSFERDAIYKLLRPFANPKVGAVSANVSVLNRNQNMLTSLQFIEYLFSITMGRIFSAKMHILSIVSGALGAFRRSLVDLNTTGGHEPGTGNDADLTIRIQKLGYVVAFVYDSICWTKVPDKMLSLWRQRLRWNNTLVKLRLRKHSDVFNIFSNNFRLINLISFCDIIFFQVITALFTPVYILYVVVYYPHDIFFIFLLNYVLYAAGDVLQLVAVCILVKRASYLVYLPYMLLFSLYIKIHKFIRLYAYWQEFMFLASYQDPFAPPKVRERMTRW